MKGKILDYTVQTSEGIISGDDNKRYRFSNSEWKSTALPKIGALVDFEANDQEAQSIYVIASTGALSPRIIASLLALLLGIFGAHKFYLGITKPAIVMLLTWVLGFLFLGIPSAIVVIISLVEAIIYFLKSDEEFEKIYIVGKKGWF